MGISLHAKVHFLGDVFAKVKTSPTNIVKQAFKDVGLDFDIPHSECFAKQSNRCEAVDVWIHNPDCYVDQIHSAFKHLTKRKDVTRCYSIEILSHYY